MNIEHEIPSYKRYRKDVILEGIIGSQSHGTYRPDHPDSIDDMDLMGIIIPEIGHYFGVKKFNDKNTMVIQEGKYDVVIHEFKKFMSLLLKNNPNVIALLWLNKEHYTNITPVGQLLIDNREIFSSRLMYKSFIGYAYGQLKKMTNLSCEGYMGAKRKALVQKYGYDTKNASHCIRLLKMCIEFLTTNKLNVFRHDREMLVEIKYGKWTLEKVQKEAERLIHLAENALVNSEVAREPDYSKVNDLMIEILMTHLELQNKSAFELPDLRNDHVARQDLSRSLNQLDGVEKPIMYDAVTGEEINADVHYTDIELEVESRR